MSSVEMHNPTEESREDKSVLPENATNVSHHDFGNELKRIAQNLAIRCADYRGAIPKRAIFQILNTLVPFLVMSGLMMWGVGRAYWLTALLLLPTGGLLVRLFIIQHDCGHRSFLKKRWTNDWLGRFISLITVTPYDYWRRAHAAHHATSGNLDRRGRGDVTTLTVNEYLSATWFRRFSYRVYRHPLIIFLIGGPLHFLVLQRFPIWISFPFRETWRSVMSLNIALAFIYVPLIMLVGLKAFLIGYLPIIAVGSWIGGWLFFVQHQYESTTWTNDETWDLHVAALNGSSYYVLPRVLQWFSGNIGLHHIHHMNSKIPNYRLQECMDAITEFKKVSRVKFFESFKCMRLALWDEEKRMMVGFRELAGRARRPAIGGSAA